jgi:hypothetical protein
MQKAQFIFVCHFLLSVFLITMLGSCTQKQDLAGKWQEVGKKSTIEFRIDGTFNAIDDMGMAVSGKYTLRKNGSIRFEIAQKSGTPEIIYGTINASGDELTFSDDDDKKVERYKRVR